MRKLKAALLAIIINVGLTGLVPAFAQSGGLEAARIDELTLKLNLSTAQQQKLKSLLARYTQQAADVRDGLIKVQQSIQGANLARLDESTIQRISREAGRLSAAHTKSLLKTQRDFYAMLSTEQKREYNKMRAEAQAAQLRLPDLPDKR